MTEINRSALLPYSASQIYDLINAVDDYPQYMDGCVATEILQLGQDADGIDFMQARLDLSKAGLQYSLTTRNRLLPPHQVQMSLVDGPFEKFSGLWTVQALGDSACKVSLALNFKLSNRVLSKAAKVLFNPMADNLVDALVKRAHYIHQ